MNNRIKNSSTLNIDPFFTWFFGVLICATGILLSLFVYRTPYDIIWNTGKYFYFPSVILIWVYFKPHQEKKESAKISSVLLVLFLALMAQSVIAGHLLWINQVVGSERKYLIEGKVTDKYIRSAHRGPGRVLHIAEIGSGKKFKLTKLSRNAYEFYEIGGMYYGDWYIGSLGLIYRHPQHRYQELKNATQAK